MIPFPDQHTDSRPRVIECHTPADEQDSIWPDTDADQIRTDEPTFIRVDRQRPAETVVAHEST